MDNREQWLLNKIFTPGQELNFSEVVLKIADMKGGLHASVNLDAVDAVQETLDSLEAQGQLTAGYRVPSTTRQTYWRNCFIKPQKTWRKNV